MYANTSYAGGQPSDAMVGTRLLVARQGRLRGHGGACGGRLVDLATTLTTLTRRPDTLTNAYKVAFCVRA